ncbi:unnamed protein product [Hymenolepis diminuta]|uniref:Uncharacterized protein n=1 Tax=Hymenolepis diminuta TaxID=6216 RepID=A0A564YRJ9_HYMDI|nr:unnamed protein product [Hymenolepis diminuta]
MLLREFSRSDHYLCSFYFQPTDTDDLMYDNSSPINLTIGGDENVYRYVGIVADFALVSDLVLSKKTNLDVFFFILALRSPCHAEIGLRLLSLLDKNSMSGSLVADTKQSLLICRFCGERRYHRDCPIEDVAARTATIMATKKASTEILLRTVQRGKTRTTREH